MNKGNIQTIILFILGFAIGGIVMYFAWPSTTSAPEEIPALEETAIEENKKSAAETTPEKKNPLIGQKAEELTSIDGLANEDATLLIVNEQVAGEQVLVERIALPEAGWVVVHEMDAGHVANALGAVRRDAGAHENILVDLLRATKAGYDYVAILYGDNGNDEFDINGDLPIVDAFGEAMIAQFSITE